LPNRRLGVFVLAGTLCLIPVSPAAAASKQHTVSQGDSLWTIAQRYGVTVEDLQRENRLSNVHKLSLGQVLRVPSAAKESVASRPSTAKETDATTQYRVRAGDTLWTIARRNGTTAARLAASNGLDDNAILALGEPLRIPGSGAKPATVNPNTTARPSAPIKGLAKDSATGAAPSRTGFDTVRVRGGDTLWSLSRRYGTTQAKIAALNGIGEQATLRLDQVIKVPVVAKRRSPPVAIRPSGAAASERVGQAGGASRRVKVASSRGGIVASMSRRFLGARYVWGGTGNGGFDCSGFIYTMYDRMGVRLPRTSFGMFGVGRSVSRLALQPGDIVFFTTYARGASHAGIYIGSGSFIHASSAGRRVRINSLGDAYYQTRYLGARRHL